MFNQSGIDTLTLYDAATTTFTVVSETEITNIVGTSILIDNEANPTLEQLNRVINRRNYFEYTFNATLFGLMGDTGQFRNKTGWLVLITFLDGEVRFLNTPVFIQETELNANKTNVRSIQFKPNRPTGKTLNVT